MEVGAVKQAFNNELILLKKKLNQAKIQVIHKLTRKAKQLVEKKAPDAMKEKFKKKAESAVNEVMIIKKIKIRDIAKFIITHKGKLQDHLNKPQVDIDKACARLLLHKVMQEKYNYIKTRFSDVPINDLLMSRIERRKLKKEAKEKQKDKKKLKDKKKEVTSNAEGDWDVEDVGLSHHNKGLSDGDDELCENDGIVSDSDDKVSEAGDEASDVEGSDNNSDDGTSDDEGGHLSDREELNLNNEDSAESEDNEPADVGKLIKLAPVNERQLTLNSKSKIEKTSSVKTNKTAQTVMKKKQKDTNKNKNFNEKILNRKFKKNVDDTPKVEKKVVDPFFITETGQNYMSVAEPRQQDEVKEEHKQGNRKLRRAVMFGHAPKIKPRQNFRENNNSNRYDKYNSRQNGFEKGPVKFDKKKEFGKNDKYNKFGDHNTELTKRRDFQNSRNSKSNESESKPEKLHPSWEAKKRQSGILPFQGKKIVFNET